jgi:chemotaxis protein methyltransferase CheR
MNRFGLDPRQFARINAFLLREAGFRLGEDRIALACARLARRLRELQLETFDDYLPRIEVPGDEARIALDLLTTHETRFFRVPAHFEQLAARLHAPGARRWRVWSAACASGEEAWSAAMTLAAALGERPWEVVATDVAPGSLATAREALYPRTRIGELPAALSAQFCVPQPDGCFTLAPWLRDRVRFQRLNLAREAPGGGRFDAIFLCNVLIYFDAATREAVLERVVARLAPDGLLFTGTGEPLPCAGEHLAPVAAHSYRRRPATSERTHA